MFEYEIHTGTDEHMHTRTHTHTGSMVMVHSTSQTAAILRLTGKKVEPSPTTLAVEEIIHSKTASITARTTGNSVT